MNWKLIEKSITIDADAEKVWNVLFTQELNKIWFAEFSEGTQAYTDWQEGSKAIFKDDTESGIIGKITVNKLHEELVIEYESMLMNGKEDFESEYAQNIKGSKETYKLKSDGPETRLDVTCDMDAEYFDMMSESWDRALNTVKELAEKK